MNPGQTVRFQSLPVGAVFSCPDPSWSPLRVKLNENSAGDYPPGPMGPGQPSYHFTGLEWCLVRERRTGPEDRRVRNDYNGHAARGPNACRGNAGRRTGDSMRFVQRKQAQDRTVRQDPKPSINDYKIGPAKLIFAGASSLSADANDVTIYYEKGKEPRIVVDVGLIEFGPSPSENFVQGIPEPTTFGERYFAKLAEDSKGKLRAIRDALTIRYGATHRDSVELVRTLVKDADAQTADIRRQGESIEGLLKAVRSHEANFERLREDSMTATREKNALEEQATRLRDRINDLECELQQTRDRMLRERARYQMAVMGRPTGIGPQAFKKACACAATFYTRCPRKFFNEKIASGRTTRMLTAALDAMIDGEKVLVCGATIQERARLLQQAEEMLRRRVQSFTTNNTLRELSCPPFPGRVRFAVLPPPVQVERIEQDLARGDIFVDHYAVERLFSILTETDGRSTAMLRLAYPNLAAQLDR